MQLSLYHCIIIMIHRNNVLVKRPSGLEASGLERGSAIIGKTVHSSWSIIRFHKERRCPLGTGQMENYRRVLDK